MLRTCSGCKEEKPPEEFYKRAIKSGYQYACKACCIARQKKWNANHPNAVRRGVLARYSLTADEYSKMVEDQDGKCAICGQLSDETLHIDHDHFCCPKAGGSCGKCIRGLLCARCNRGLGGFNDSPDTLIAASNYLINYNRKR